MEDSSSSRTDATHIEIFSHLQLKVAKWERVAVSRDDRELYLVLLASGGEVFLKRHFHAEGFSRELEALVRVPVEVAPTLIQADSRFLAIVTQRVPGLPAHLLKPYEGRELLRRSLSPFTKLLDLSGVQRLDPVPFPTQENFEKYFAELAHLAHVSTSGLVDFLRADQPLLPCHGDLTPRNVLYGDQVRFIDWEWFGIAQPLYDAACLCLSPSLCMSAAERVDQMMAFVASVEERASVPIEAIAGASVAWAVRFADALDRGRARVDLHMPWTIPLQCAANALQILTL